MRKTTHKQAIQINNLSYIYYNLLDSEDTNVLVTYDKAISLPYHMSEKMIKDLMVKIETMEHKKFYEDYLWTTDRLERHSFIEFVNNYKEIDSFKIRPHEKKAEITTIDGKTINIDLNTRLMNEQWNMSIDDLRKTLVQAIDESKRVNIYNVNNKVNHIFIEDQERDIQYKWVAEKYNKLLEATNGMLPHNTKGQIQYEKTINIFKTREMDTYLELKPYMKNKTKFDAIKTIIGYGDKGFFGLTLADREVYLY